jgi:hypothetical protein
LTGADIAPLEVVDTVELEMLEGLAESGGPGLRDVLAGKAHATLFRNSVRGYLTRECRFNIARSQRLSELVDKAWEPAREALPPQALDVQRDAAGGEASADGAREGECEQAGDGGPLPTSRDAGAGGRSHRRPSATAVRPADAGSPEAGAIQER